MMYIIVHNIAPIVLFYCVILITLANIVHVVHICERFKFRLVLSNGVHHIVTVRSADEWPPDLSESRCAAGAPATVNCKRTPGRDSELLCGDGGDKLKAVAA